MTHESTLFTETIKRSQSQESLMTQIIDDSNYRECIHESWLITEIDLNHTELAKNFCPRLRDLATVPAGRITQPWTHFFGQLCMLDARDQNCDRWRNMAGLANALGSLSYVVHCWMLDGITYIYSHFQKRIYKVYVHSSWVSLPFSLAGRICLVERQKPCKFFLEMTVCR